MQGRGEEKTEIRKFSEFFLTEAIHKRRRNILGGRGVSN